jgi:hypothetical protein
MIAAAALELAMLLERSAWSWPVRAKVEAQA